VKKVLQKDIPVMAYPNEAKAKEAFDEAQKACIMPMMGQNTRPRKCHVYLLS
jgi:hypothetical protein